MAGLPAPVDISHHFSELTKRREASQVKRFYKYFQIPGIGQLAGGLPFHGYFPFDTLEAASARPNRFQTTPNDPVDQPSSAPTTANKGSEKVNPEASQVVVPGETNEQNLLRKIDLETALQYGQAQGYPPLWSWVRTFTTKHLHPNVKYEGGVEITLTVGNTDGMAKSLEALTNTWVPGINAPEGREGMLCEEFAYMTAIQTAQARGLNIVPVKVDGEGMMATGEGGLKDVLENWDTSRGRRPRVMYTVSIGQNPTGVVLGMERRKEIYDLCAEYDVVIIEDEPYWFLQYPSATKEPAYAPHPDDKSSGYPFIDSLVPSYVSIDYQGRVLRLDTFSKTVAPGCRLGWVTGQPALVERIQRIAETSSAGPSGFVQSIIAELVMGPDGKKLGPGQQDGWDMSGWVRWLEGLRGNYERRMTTLCDILDDGAHLVKSGRRPSLSQLSLAEMDEWGVIERTQMYRFDRPAGGMFVWVEMLYGSHPLSKDFEGADLATALWVFLTTKPYLVLVAPGSIFGSTPELRAEKAWRYFRLSFVADEEELITKSGTGFIRGVAAFWRIKDRDEIKKLLDEAKAEGRSVDADGATMWACPSFY